MSKEVVIVHCPTCQKESPWDNNHPFRPFCSHRCKLIDLGQWASESYTLEAKEERPSQES